MQASKSQAHLDDKYSVFDNLAGAGSSLIQPMEQFTGNPGSPVPHSQPEGLREQQNQQPALSADQQAAQRQAEIQKKLQGLDDLLI